MHWAEVIGLFFTFSGMVWLMHRESVKMHFETREAISKEMKDFHGRLCILEERYIQLMQRIFEKKD